MFMNKILYVNTNIKIFKTFNNFSVQAIISKDKFKIWSHLQIKNYLIFFWLKATVLFADRSAF